MAYLGLDVGTTGSKATVINAAGSVTAYAYKEYAAILSSDGRAEIDPNAVWAGVKAVLSAAAGESTERIEAIAIASFGESFVMLDESDHVLSNSMLFSDVRGAEEISDILAKISEEKLFDITGMPINSMYTLNKLLWHKKHEPRLLSSAKKMFFFEDYIYYKLSGERKVDYSLASRTLFFDYKNKKWSDEILGLFDLKANAFSEPVATGQVVGKVSAKIAAELNLSPGTLLVAGAHDQVCAALGAGVLKSGDSVDGMGTSECITAMLGRVDQAEYMRKNNFCIEPYAIAGEYVTLAFNSTGGSVLRWYRDTFEKQRFEQAAQSGESIYSIMEKDCPSEPTGLFVLPHFSGTGTPYMDPYSSGAILGLKLSTTKGDIYKACLEGICFEMKLNVEILKGMGTTIENLTCVGGGTRSDLLLQIKADIMGIEVRRLEVEESGTMALAILCATACGAYESLSQAAKALVKVKRTFEPNRNTHAIYTQKYDKYKNIYKNIKNIGLSQ